jgi:chromosome segregation ATPase
MTLAKLFEAIQGLPAQIAALLHDAKDAAAKLTTASQERDAATAKVTKLESDLTAANATIAERDQTIATLTGERDTAAAEVTKLKGAAKTVEQQATEQVAALGIDPLPAAGASEKQTDQRAALRARLIKSTDPIERAALSRQLRDLK